MEPNMESNLFELHIDHNISNYLRETARWAKFVAIIGFVYCGLTAIFGLSATAIFSLFASLTPGAEMAAGMGGFFAVIYIGIAVVNFFPCFYLFNFASRVRPALESNDQTRLDSAFKNLKSCFQFIGILMIIGLAFVALGILGVAASLAMTRH